MNCARGRRRRHLRPQTRLVTGEVVTAPCPVCRSFHTRAWLRDGEVLFRGCLTCGHTWDDVRGEARPRV